MMTSISNFAPFIIPFFLSAMPVVGAPTSTVASPYTARHDAKFNDLRERSSQPTGIDDGAASALEVRTLAQQAEWLSRATDKCHTYSAVSDGWKGDDSFAPSPAVIAQAKVVLSQIATEMPSLPEPSISADVEGSLCLYWRNPPLLASIVAYGDGTYSFFAEGYAAPARSDSEIVGLPLPPALVGAMVGIPEAHT